MIVEMVSIDSSFDPYYPEIYYLEKQRRSLIPPPIENNLNSDNSVVTSPQVRRSNQDWDVSPTKPLGDAQPYYYPRSSCVKCSVQSSNRSKKVIYEEKCLICLSDERTATLVHGETGHIACCLGCARILKARGDKVHEYCKCNSSLDALNLAHTFFSVQCAVYLSILLFNNFGRNPI